MARSERYIPATQEQIRRWEIDAELKQQFDHTRSELIETALHKLRKDDLIALLMHLDTFDPAVRWAIEAELNLKKPPKLIAHDLRSAIQIATKVDERQINRNFDYSWQAYEEVGRGFRALLSQNEMELAKEIALEFMRKASHQVECSDEGMMADEIEACLEPVCEAIALLESDVRKKWVSEMLLADHCGFICRVRLETLCAAG